MTRPILQRPTYIGLRGAPDAGTKPEEVPVKVKAVGGFGDALLGAMVGAVAAYFVPKLLDRVMPSQLDPQHGEEVTLDIDDG